MKPTTFLLRDVPDVLHRYWKIFASVRGFSMRTYALLALEAQVERDKDQLGKKEGDQT